MSDSNDFAWHRPELAGALRRGDRKIADLMRPNVRSFAPRGIIIQQERESSCVYRMRSGWAGRVRSLPDGRSQFILLFLPGDLFAVKSMFLIRHSDSIEALSGVVVEEIHQRELKALFDTDSDVATRCNWQVVEEERRLHNWVVALGQGNAAERVAHLLLELRTRLVRSGEIEADSDEFAFPLRQEQLAGLLGISIVHLNRVLKRFREDEIAFIRSGKVRIADMSALRRLGSAIQDGFEREASAAAG